MIKLISTDTTIAGSMIDELALSMSGIGVEEEILDCISLKIAKSEAVQNH